MDLEKGEKRVQLCVFHLFQGTRLECQEDGHSHAGTTGGPPCAFQRNGHSMVSAVRLLQDPRARDLAAAVATPGDRDRGDPLELDLARGDLQPRPGWGGEPVADVQLPRSIRVRAG
jgi:hypothetical protein